MGTCWYRLVDAALASTKILCVSKNRDIMRFCQYDCFLTKVQPGFTAWFWLLNSDFLSIFAQMLLGMTKCTIGRITFVWSLNRKLYQFELQMTAINGAFKGLN